MRMHSHLVLIAVVACSGCRMLDTYFPADAGYTPPPPPFQSEMAPVTSIPSSAPMTSYPSNGYGAPALDAGTSIPPASGYSASQYQPYQAMPPQQMSPQQIPHQHQMMSPTSPTPAYGAPLNNGTSRGAVPQMNYGTPMTVPHGTQRPETSIRGASAVMPSELSSATDNTKVAWQTLATSSEGRAIQYRTVGNGHQHVLVIGSLHGDETNGVALIDRLAASLAQPGQLQGVTVYLIRDANPDGRVQRRRENANLVDLNRNFATADWRRVSRGGALLSGRQPHSEPECQAISDWILRAQPDRILLFTSQTATGAVSHSSSAIPLAESFSRTSATRLVRPAAEEMSGSLLSFAEEKQIETLVIDLPRYARLDEIWARYREPVLSAIAAAPSPSNTASSQLLTAPMRGEIGAQSQPPMNPGLAPVQNAEQPELTPGSDMPGSFPDMKLPQAPIPIFSPAVDE